MAFRSREALFIPANRWKNGRRAHYRRLALPTDANVYLAPLIERAKVGVAAVAQAAHAGELTIDDELYLTPLAAEEEDPRVGKLRAALDHRLGDTQLPDIILAVDAQVRFSWIMLGREPRSPQELLMVYAGVLAHGTSMSAAETARMIPSLTAASVRQAMRWASNEQRLQEACRAVLDFMQRHPVTTAWGRADLASSDMMSLETSKRVWQARIDPRRQTSSIGIYSPARADEIDDVLRLLLDHRSDDSEETRWLAHAIATACLGENHLYQDMGLTNRMILSELLRRHFSTLYEKNTGNMKWKKFFYKQLCERAEINICKAPSCKVCDDYAKCFGPE